MLDDGFQHRRIERDLNLALIDATDPFGCGHVFPRGMLREPMTGIRRADVVCLTRCDLVSEAELSAIEMRYRRLNEQALFLRLCHRPCRWINSAGRALPLDAMQGRSVAAFCALGNPDAFRKTLESCGCQVKRFHTFPDHHHLSESDVTTLAQNAAEEDVDFVVCSHKDLVKLDREQIGEKQVFALQIEIDFASKRDELLQTLARVLDQVRIGAGKRLE